MHGPVGAASYRGPGRRSEAILTYRYLFAHRQWHTHIAIMPCHCAQMQRAQLIPQQSGLGSQVRCRAPNLGARQLGLTI